MSTRPLRARAICRFRRVAASREIFESKARAGGISPLRMKSSLLTFLCSSALLAAAVAQIPTPPPDATAPPAPTVAATPAAVAPTAVPAASTNPNSLEAQIERKVRRSGQKEEAVDVDAAPERHGRPDKIVVHRKGGDSEDLGALMAIPIVGIIFSTLFGAPVLIVGLIMLFSFWKARSLHRTVRLLVEKGQPVPEALFATAAVRTRSDMRRGIILLMVGLGLMVFLGADNNWRGGSWAIGAIPFLIGLGYLLVWKLESSKAPLVHRSTDNQPPVA